MANEVFKNDAGIQGLWLLEETSGNRSDSSPNGNTLTDNNTVGSSTNAQEGNRSAEFVAANTEYLSITDAAQSGLAITGNLSACCWVRPASIGSAMVLVSKYLTTGNQRSYRFLIQDTTGVLLVNLSSNGSTSVGATGATTLSINTWYHCAFVYNGTDIRIYLNGSLDSNGSDNPRSYSSGIFDSSADFMLGKQDGFSNPLDGRLDEVAVFDRALSAAEVARIYAVGILDVIPVLGEGMLTGGLQPLSGGLS